MFYSEVVCAGFIAIVARTRRSGRAFDRKACMECALDTALLKQAAYGRSRLPESQKSSAIVAPCTNKVHTLLSFHVQPIFIQFCRFVYNQHITTAVVDVQTICIHL
ncbi:hypothetical protein PoB_007572300 [Plakobranchus ocellatus]|uniref:Uncharacterized protein n=1 Tax=Plakobranchus ocellatus TaxID=259542 RepID=A0AAV4DY57_9GAST|nr:hypothetical protein PoB_007572300 [Plakobranchus ocellatus]